MWKDVITSIYNPKYHSLIPQYHITGAGSTWSRLVNYCGKDTRLRNIVTNNTVMLVGNGKRIKFWLDDWTYNGRLVEKFPTLFQLPRKDGNVEWLCMVLGFLLEQRFERPEYWTSCSNVRYSIKNATGQRSRG